MPLEHYNFDYWTKLITTAQNKINGHPSAPLKKSKIYTLVTNRYFLFGFFSGILFLAGMTILWAVNKKIKTNPPSI
jgi:gamma-glutamylcysteine synthetase